MGFFDMFFGGSDEKRIKNLKKKRKVREIAAYYKVEDPEIKQLAIDTLEELVQEGNLSATDEEAVIDFLDPLIRIKDRQKINKMEDAYEMRRIAVNEYLPKRDFVMAVYALEKAIELKPDDTSMMNNLAAAHSLSKNFKKAQEVWEEILKKSPNDSTAIENYAMALYINSRQYIDNEKTRKQGEEMLLRAIELSPSHINSIFEIAMLYQKDKNLEKTLYYLKKCLNNAKVPSGYSSVSEFKAWVNRYIAECYQDMAEPDQAINFYRDALSYYNWDEPEQIKMKEALEALGG